jgi:hypothetical protein
VQDRTSPKSAATPRGRCRQGSNPRHNAWRGNAGCCSTPRPTIPRGPLLCQLDPRSSLSQSLSARYVSLCVGPRPTQQLHQSTPHETRVRRVWRAGHGQLVAPLRGNDETLQVRPKDHGLTGQQPQIMASDLCKNGEEKQNPLLHGVGNGVKPLGHEIRYSVQV